MEKKKKQSEISRRGFIKTAVAGTAVLAVPMLENTTAAQRVMGNITEGNAP